MMDLFKSVADLKSNFIYTPEKIDHWKLWPKKGIVKDDCDGFSLNLVLRHFGEFWKPIFQKKAVLYHCTYYGVGHMVVKIGGYYCDNIQRVPFEQPGQEYAGFKAYSPAVVVLNYFGIKSVWFKNLTAAVTKLFK